MFANITDTYLKKMVRFSLCGLIIGMKSLVCYQVIIALVQRNQGVADNSNTTTDNEEFVSKLFVKNKWKNQRKFE